MTKADKLGTRVWSVSWQAAGFIRAIQEAPTREALDLVIAPLTDQNHPVRKSMPPADVEVIRKAYVDCRSRLRSCDTK